MPLYEYDCLSCGASFEALVKRASESAVCPKCGSDHLSKKFSTFSTSASGGHVHGPGCGCAPSPAACASPNCCQLN